MIIGCGNRDRGDDAAGLLVALRLRELGIDAAVQSGEGLTLMASWEGAENVILIDAVVTGAPPGTIHAWDARAAPLASETFCSTHGFGVAEAIKLAQALGTLPPRVTIYGIEGRDFAHGAAASAAVLAAVEQLARRIAREVAPCTNPA